MTARPAIERIATLARAIPLLLVTLICCAAGAQGAAAAPPSNDAFAGATPLAVPAEVQGTVAESTREPGEPMHDGLEGTGGVWYSFTPAETMAVIARTCQAQFDTVLAVYTGDGIAALTRVTSNDDSCETGSLVTFTATAGTTYSISVSPYEALRPTDQGNFTLSLAVLMPPANDSVAQATPIAAVPATIAGTVAESTREVGEPAHAGRERVGSVWYSFTPTETRSVIARTCQAQFDTVLAVYAPNAAGALTSVAADDDSCGTGSLLGWTATAGTTYFIAVAPFDTLPPNDQANFTLSLAAGTRPANDAFASARRVTEARTVRGSNVLATRQSGEPRHFSGGGHSVWFRYRATRTRSVTLETRGSSFDTVLAVYRGNLGRLRRIARDDDGGPSFTSRIRLRVQRGRTYFIALDGTVSETGNWAFRLARRRAR